MSYYDSRCAAQVFDELGSRCTWEPQYGQCTVRASSKVELYPSTVSQICCARKDDSDLYSLLFYDVRAAETFAAEVGSTMDCRQQKKAFIAPAQTPRRATPVAPRYLNDLGISQVVWADLDSGLETRTTLRITRLCQRLCNPKRFQMLLEEANLAQYVDVFRTFATARGCGAALLNVTSALGVKIVAKFFHGRQWGKTMPASVSFAVTQGRDEVLAKYPIQESSSLASRISKEPLQVVLRSVESTSEMSTEASECDSDGSSSRGPAS